MFSESAGLYDLVYSSFKDYPAEASKLAGVIRGVHPDALRVLDVACGTGEHARLLTERYGFHADGLDLDPGMIRIAAGKNPVGDFRVADMTDFDLPGRYDVVTCLFSSIGYVRTLANVERALACFGRHLAAGGAIIVEPWFPPGMLESGKVMVATAQRPGVSVCRMSHCRVEGRLSTLTFEYLVGRGEGIEHARETHELGLFTREEMESCFRSAGLAVTYDAEGLSGRGLYVARRA